MAFYMCINKDLRHIIKTRLECLVAYPWRRLVGVVREEHSSRSIPINWPEFPKRMDFLNEICVRSNVQAYLEIGCRDDECFSRIGAKHKVGVDPNSGGTVRASSDYFFQHNNDKFDLVFIDGLHLYEQVLRDIRNALEVLNPGGVIVLHDCLPLTSEAQYRRQCTRYWNGDVWKAIVEIRTWEDIDTATCLIDHGLGIIRPRPNTDILAPPVTPFPDLPFEFLTADYQRLLRTMDYQASLIFATSESCNDFTRVRGQWQGQGKLEQL